MRRVTARTRMGMRAVTLQRVIRCPAGLRHQGVSSCASPVSGPGLCFTFCVSVRGPAGKELRSIADTLSVRRRGLAGMSLGIDTARR